VINIGIIHDRSTVDDYGIYNGVMS